MLRQATQRRRNHEAASLRSKEGNGTIAAPPNRSLDAIVEYPQMQFILLGRDEPGK